MLDYTFVTESWATFAASVSLVVGGIITSPTLKFCMKIFTALGSLAAIGLWLESNPKAAKILLLVIITVALIMTTGCASPSFNSADAEDGVIQERGLYGGDYCAVLRTTFYSALAEYKECKGGTFAALLGFRRPDNDDNSSVDSVVHKECTGNLSTVRLNYRDYENCFEAHRTTKFFFNPTFKYVIPEEL